MIYREDLIQVVPLTLHHLDNFVEFFGGHVLPLAERHGRHLVAAWQRLEGSANNIIHLWEFESLTAMEQIDEACYADPLWCRRIAEIETRCGLMMSRLLRPTPYAPPALLHQAIEDEPDHPRFFIQAITQVPPGQLENFCRYAGEEFEPAMRRAGGRLIAGWETLIGRANEITDIWVRSPRLRSYRRASEETRTLWEGLRAYTLDEVVYDLVPLPYSPLQ